LKLVPHRGEEQVADMIIKASWSAKEVERPNGNWIIRKLELRWCVGVSMCIIHATFKSVFFRVCWELAKIKSVFFFFKKST
jgi:hypothetical protein